MYAIRFIIIRIRNIIIPSIILFFIFFLVAYSTTNMEAAKAGLNLWVKSIFPSLFPFFIATELLGMTKVIPFLGKIFHKIMRPIFNVPGEGIFPLIMGIISGYPIGAKIVVNMYEQNKLNKIEAERLLAFTNNSNPLFILATVGISLFSSSKIGIILLISHIISALIVGFLFRWWKKKEESFFYNNFRTEAYNTITLENLGEVLSKSVSSAIHSVCIVGGFVVLFSVICSILERSHIFIFFSILLSPFLNIINISTTHINSLLTGFIELTNGLKSLSLVGFSNTTIYIASFLLGFGGISILLQILSIISKAKLSIRPYIIGKIMQAFISTTITILIL